MQPNQQGVITHPQQLMQLSEEQRQAYLIEDAKRAKRNHKIYMLSKGNGLMTPQDKNFITRIQLQQLVTATGGVNENDPEAALAEDFYYQVHNQIRGGPRQNPHQPLGHFAQTYLFQTGGRGGGRRNLPNGDNHVQRMQQQVQRAVEAAKQKPKNKQLIIEGSLGKISFSNAKTPKPLLNLKRNESDARSKKVVQADLSLSDRKTILKNIENVYSLLMQLEDNMRLVPSDDGNEPSEERISWMAKMNNLNSRIWNELRILEPINPGSSTPHPFIAILSYPKGKKAIPRIFRHLSDEQRITLLTIVVVHLDYLDVVRRAQLPPGDAQLPLAVREEIALFSQTVMPCLMSYVSDASLNIIIGLLGLILQQTNVQAVARTEIGLAIFTMLLSRAATVEDAGKVDEREWREWTQSYNALFDLLDPVLGIIFPSSVSYGEDMYVWQFLATVGAAASPEQQQRLVIAVK